MAQYRKKPVVIDAIQWRGPIIDADYLTSFDRWMVVHRDSKAPKVPRYVGESVVIQTLEGPMTASPGDWIICGVQGELYPCKPDIFAATYEQVL
jgi:hypothetical protein